eukprot:1064418-Amphidinium_carterae.1
MAAQQVESNDSAPAGLASSPTPCCRSVGWKRPESQEDLCPLIAFQPYSSLGGQAADAYMMPRLILSSLAPELCFYRLKQIHGLVDCIQEPLRV